MVVDPHPFSLEALAAEREKNKRPNSIDLTTAFGISTTPSTPSVESGSEVVISQSMRAKPSRAIQQVFPAGSNVPIRPWPAIPVATSPEPTSGREREGGAGRPDSETLGSFASMPGPPWVRPLPPNPPVMVEVAKSNRSNRSSLQFSPQGQGAATARSSVVYGSDILRGKRVYDPTRDITDVSSDKARRNSTSSFQSPQTTGGGHRHWSYIPSPLKEETDSLSIVNESGGVTMPMAEEQPIAGSSQKRKGTFGAKSGKSTISRTGFSRGNRRSSADWTGLHPPELLEAPPSPSSAPVFGQSRPSDRSNNDYVPIASAALSPSSPFTNRGTGKDAVSTSIAAEPLSATRVRFGARPPRPGLPGNPRDVFQEDGLPRSLLQSPPSASATSFDKLK